MSDFPKRPRSTAGRLKQSASVDSLDHEPTHGDESDDPTTEYNVPGSSGGDWTDTGPLVDLSERYDVLEPLGTGGMGDVFRAFDRKLRRQVALKRLKPELSGNRRAVQRFLKEAIAIAAVQHNNIVNVFDYGHATDGHFIILELVEGQSLADRLREDGPIDPNEAIDIVCQICDALSVTHSKAIIHRDIKPANILLTSDGVPKLSDFGVARLETVDGEKTQSGAVVGTLVFMPPEQQLDATLADPRSDLWSLAASLYQMLTGDSPRIIRPERIPEAIRPVLMKALEERLSDRFQSASEFRSALLDAVTVDETGIGTLAPGQCPGCGRINSAEDTFCRQCGEALKQPCPKCSVSIDSWDEFCGSCGAAVAEELKKRQAALRTEWSKIQTLRNSYRHTEAIPLCERMAAVDHPRLREFADHAQKLLPKLQTELAQFEEQRSQLVSAAEECLSDHDYNSAAQSLKQIPEALRNEYVSILLRDAEAHAQEVRDLAAQIKQAQVGNDTATLRPLLTRFLELKPNHASARRLAEQHGLDARRQAQRGPSHSKRRPKFELLAFANDVPTKIAVFVVFTSAAMLISLAIIGIFYPPLSLWKDTEVNSDTNGKSDETAPDVVGSMPVHKTDIGLEMIAIPAGQFDMGAPTTDFRADDDERPQHAVSMTKPFYISSTEVTQAQYEAVMNENPSHFLGDDLPVHGITWDEAVEFCQKLSALEGARFRLPTEAEWEYACRAGDDAIYQTGDKSDQLTDVAWFTLNSKGQPHAVGQKSKNRFGLHDMHGNVSEWCQDWYDAQTYARSPRDDPTGPSDAQSNAATTKIIRGGSWFDNESQLRSSYRGAGSRSMRSSRVGFRVVMEVE